MMQDKPRKKKATKNMVPVGTQLPFISKLTLEAIAEGQDKSVYEYLQDLILKDIAAHEKEMEKLKKRKAPPAVVEEDNGEDLLS